MDHLSIFFLLKTYILKSLEKIFEAYVNNMQIFKEKSIRTR